MTGGTPGPSVPIGLRIGVGAPQATVFIGFKAPHVAAGLLIEVGGVQGVAHLPATQVRGMDQGELLLTVPGVVSIAVGLAPVGA